MSIFFEADFLFFQVLPSKGTLELQVSLDGNRFASGKFPPSMHPETHVRVSFLPFPSV